MEKYDLEPYNEDVKRHLEREEAYLRAKKRLDKIVGFYRHLTVYIVVNTFLIILITMNRDEADSFWDFGTFATAFFWGIGLMFHFLGTCGKDFIFGRNWENRKIREFMDKEQDEQRRYQ